MASFCTKCGASVPPESQFCTACGAPIQGVTAAPPTPPPYMAAPQPPPPYTPPYTNTAPAPPQSVPFQPAPVQGGSGSGALKVILIVVGVVVLLGIIGASIFAFTVWRVTRGIHVSNNGDKVSINTPGGSISANSGTTYSASELGTDIYPGAAAAEGGMKMDLPTGSMITAVYQTSDSKEQVLSFYKSKFGSDASTIDTSNGAVVTLKKGENEMVMVTISSESDQHDGKTQISITHTKSTK